MKVAIVHNSEEKSKQVTKQLTTLLEQNQIQIDNRQPELVISVVEMVRFFPLFIDLIIC